MLHTFKSTRIVAKALDVALNICSSKIFYPRGPRTILIQGPREGAQGLLYHSGGHQGDMQLNYGLP